VFGILIFQTNDVLADAGDGRHASRHAVWGNGSERDFA